MARMTGNYVRYMALSKAVGAMVVVVLATVGILAAGCASQPAPTPTKAPAAPAPAQPTTAPAAPKAPAAQPTAGAAATIAPAAAAPAAVPKSSWRPSKPPTMIVQYAAGGGVDMNARVVAQNATKYVGQTIAVVNKAAGAGVPGSTEVADSKPDGMTMGILGSSQLLDPYLVKGVTYTIKSFRPIIQIAFEPNVLVVRPGTPQDKPIKEFMAYAKQNTGKLKIGTGSSWTGQQFTRASMEMYGDFTMQRVTFSGGAPAVQALLAGDVDLAVPYVSEVIQHIQAGKLKPLAVAGPTRSFALPDVPTFIESGYSEISWGVFRVIGVAAATPDEIVNGYYDAFKQTLDDPVTTETYQKMGLEKVIKNPAEAMAYLLKEEERHKKIVEQLGLKPN